jgi:hypothetical protein
MRPFGIRNTSLKISSANDPHRFLVLFRRYCLHCSIYRHLTFLGQAQRVLNEFRGPGFLVVWFGSFPTPSPSPVSKLDRRHTWEVREIQKLADGRGCRGCGRSQIKRRRGSLGLYKSFNTLWSSLSQREGRVVGGGGVWPPHTQQGPLKLYPSLGWKLCKPHGLPTAGSADLPQGPRAWICQSREYPRGWGKDCLQTPGWGEGVLINRPTAQR